MKIARNQAVKSDTVTEDIAWLNRNPFRHTDLVLRRGTETGTTDIVLQTKDRFALRVYAGYENAGTKEAGEDLIQAGANWGNASIWVIYWIINIPGASITKD